jgi:hypothetical protein
MRADFRLDPYFYIPASVFAKGVLVQDSTQNSKSPASAGKLVVGDKTTDRVIIFSSSLEGPLSGLVRVEFKSIGMYLPSFIANCEDEAYFVSRRLVCGGRSDNRTSQGSLRSD